MILIFPLIRSSISETWAEKLTSLIWHLTARRNSGNRQIVLHVIPSIMLKHSSNITAAIDFGFEIKRKDIFRCKMTVFIRKQYTL